MSSEAIRKELEREWQKLEWFDEGQIASKLRVSKRSIRNWRHAEELKMIKNPIWKARGEWVIDFLVNRNMSQKVD
jgi:hypothetical protein